MPEISVIVPVYKVEAYLHQCVDSILGQTFSDFELILVDDGSPDNCPAICDAYAVQDSRVRVIHQKNRGVSAARNAALEIVQGSYVAFVDSDDWLNANWLASIKQCIDRFDPDEIVYLFNKVKDGNIIHEEGTLVSPFITFTQAELYDHIFLQGNRTLLNYVWNKVFKYSAIGQVRFEETLKWGEDTEFSFQVLKNMKSAVLINERLYNWRIRAGSANDSKNDLERIQFMQYQRKQALDLKRLGYMEHYGKMYNACIDALLLAYNKCGDLQLHKCMRKQFVREIPEIIRCRFIPFKLKLTYIYRGILR